MKYWFCAWFWLVPMFAHAGEPSVLVETAPLGKASLNLPVSGYGTVYSDPAAILNVDEPRAGQILRMKVDVGQVVRKGTVLYLFSTDPVAASGYAQAESSLELAKSAYRGMQRLHERQLATNAQLAAAKKALEDAESALRAQQKIGSAIAEESVRAPFDAVVSSVSALPGDRIQPGRTILQLAKRNALLVKIGIEPERAAQVAQGMKVRLLCVFDSGCALQGTVGSVHGMIDPQTRLVDVIVNPQGNGLLPGMKLRGEIEVPRGAGWVVPRSAVLSDERGSYLFQDDHGRAKRVAVTAKEAGAETAVVGNFDPKLPVVVLGNYELQDGMKLREGKR
ncbi:MAG: efflux RND transporter periplasmic adaptor subunit [Burkholderiales bacterium]|nr:efflux RND transporter periplasmic adaptor subunit [Burkholderiales bacterium]